MSFCNIFLFYLNILIFANSLFSAKLSLSAFCGRQCNRIDISNTNQCKDLKIGTSPLWPIFGKMRSSKESGGEAASLASHWPWSCCGQRIFCQVSRYPHSTNIAATYCWPAPAHPRRQPGLAVRRPVAGFPRGGGAAAATRNVLPIPTII